MAVPADGVVPYKYFTVQTNFNEDKWIQAAEIRPSNRKVVHHVIVFVQEPGAKTELSGEGRGGRGFKLCGFAPGEQPKVFPPGTARLITKAQNSRFKCTTRQRESSTDRSYRVDLFQDACSEDRFDRHGYKRKVCDTAG